VLNTHAIKELARKKIITGENKYLKLWEMMIMLLVVWQALYVPTILSFEPIIGRGMWAFDKIVDIFFIIDFLAQFNIARKSSEGFLPKTRKEVAKAYAKSGTPMGTWFLIDISASFPYDWVTQPIADAWSYDVYVDQLKLATGRGDLSGGVRIVKILRLPRLLRLLKIFRLLSAFKRFEKFQKFLKYSRYGHLLRLVTKVLQIVVLGHYGACLWYGVAGPSSHDGEWFQFECINIYKHCGDTWFYNTTEKQMQCYEDCNYPNMSQYQLGSNFWTLYVTAYFAIIAMMTAGENLSPISVNEKLVSIFFILMGSIVMAIVFGEVAVLLSNFYARQSRYQTKMEYLFESMKRMGLPPEIEKRVYSYYDYIHETHGTLNGETTAFIPELSKKLAAEVLMYLRMEMIHKVPFFQNISPEVVQQLVLKLTLQVFLPKEYICVRGEVGDEMFFISDGECEVTIPFKDMPQDKKDEILRQKLKDRLLKQQTGTRKASNFNFSSIKGTRRKSNMQAQETTGVQSEILSSGRDNSEKHASARHTRSAQWSSFTQKASSVRNIPNISQKKSTKEIKGLGKNEDEIGNEPIHQSSSAVTEVRKTSFVQLFKKQRKSSVGMTNDNLGIDPDKEMVLATLNKGAHFGEIALILLTKRTANVRAKGFCELCGLNRDTYNMVVAVYIEDKKAMEDYILTKYGKSENVKDSFEKEQRKRENDDFNMAEEDDDEEDEVDTPKSPKRKAPRSSHVQNARVVTELKAQASIVADSMAEGIKSMNERIEQMAKLQNSNKERMEDMNQMMEKLRQLEYDRGERGKKERLWQLENEAAQKSR